jgi:prepilin-type N-terminal cleavage/methylation domain-containing protein
MLTQRRAGFTLVEVLIVVVIMAVLAATIIPQFADSTKDAKTSGLKFNLHTLRSQIQMYKSQHDGKLPTGTLVELISKTDSSGTVGTGATNIYGPYMMEIPDNPYSSKATVKVITTSPAVAGDVTASNGGGWLYNATTGEIWADNATWFTE